MANVQGPRLPGIPAAAFADAARRAGAAAPRAAVPALGRAVPAAAAAAGTGWLFALPWASIVAGVRFFFYLLSWGWLAGLVDRWQGQGNLGRVRVVDLGGAPFAAGDFGGLHGAFGHGAPPDPFAPAAAARRRELQQMSPQQAYAAVADGRFGLEELVGRHDVDGGVYAPELVEAHLREGLVPEALLAPLFALPSWRRMVYVTSRGSLRAPQGARGYGAAACAWLERYPAAAIYAMARANVVDMQGVLLGLPPEALRTHANAGALRLDADPFRPATPDAALRLAALGLLDVGALRGHWSFAACGAAVQRGEGREQLRRQDVLGCLSAADVAQATRAGWATGQAFGEGLSPAQLNVGLDSGVVRLVHVSGRLTAPSVARMERLVAAANGSWAAWFVRWPHPEAELRRALELGHLQPFHLQLGGPCQAVAAALLWQAGRIDDGLAAAVAAKHWDGTPHLPVATAELVRSYPSLSHLVRHVPLPLPSPQGAVGARLTLAQRRRNAGYLALCVATWVDGAAAAAAPAAQRARRAAANAPSERSAQSARRLFVDHFREQQRARSLRSAAATPAPAAALPTAVECIGCGDEVPRGELVVLDRCGHPAQYDRDCFLRGLEIGGGHRCPGTDCQRPLGLFDALQLALPADRALALAGRAARDALEAQQGWARCRTADCLGGRVELQASRAPIDCRCCGVRAPALRGEVQRYANLTAAERDQVRMLVDFAGVAGARRDSDLRPIRECYHCGMLTEHQEQCMSLDCRPIAGGCGAAWNFVDGRSGRHQFGMGPATYVPRAGWLLELGLYQGLQPGATDVDVRPVMARNLARLRSEAG